MNYYLILNINSNASDCEIKNAYRKQILKYHPDKNKNNNNDNNNMFCKINEAYQILYDPVKRCIYDTYGLDGLKKFELEKKQNENINEARDRNKKNREDRKKRKEQKEQKEQIEQKELREQKEKELREQKEKELREQREQRDKELKEQRERELKEQKKRELKRLKEIEEREKLMALKRQKEIEDEINEKNKLEKQQEIEKQILLKKQKEIEEREKLLALKRQKEIEDEINEKNKLIDEITNKKNNLNSLYCNNLYLITNQFKKMISELKNIDIIDPDTYIQHQIISNICNIIVNLDENNTKELYNNLIKIKEYFDNDFNDELTNKNTRGKILFNVFLKICSKFSFETHLFEKYKEFLITNNKYNYIDFLFLNDIIFAHLQILKFITKNVYAL